MIYVVDVNKTFFFMFLLTVDHIADYFLYNKLDFFKYNSENLWFLCFLYVFFAKINCLNVKP